MSKSILPISVFLLIGHLALAQCEKKITWTGTKAEFIDSTGAVKDTKEETIIIETSKTEITIRHGNHDDDILKGNVKVYSCEWKDSFKNGKTTVNGEFSKVGDAGNPEPGQVTIEGKDGKILIIIALDKMESLKIRVPVIDYKESNQ